MSTVNQPTYRCAIIGVGRFEYTSQKGGGHQIGHNHATMYRENPRFSLVAGADINAENLAAYQRKFEVPGGYSDYRQMLEKERPDVVSICTYVGLHERMLVDCAEAGVKGVFLEKPVLHSPAALRRVEEVIARTGIKVCVAHVRRHLPNMGRIRDMVANGAIGEPLLFAAGIDNWDLSEWGSHWLDIFRFFNGDRPVSWVMAQARVRGQRGYGHAMEEHAVCNFEFDNRARGFLDGGRQLGREDKAAGVIPATITILGTQGAIYLRDWVKRLEVFDRNGRREIVDPTGGDSGEDFRNTWTPYGAGLAEWLDGGAAPLTGWPHVRGSTELNLAAYVSAVRGDRVDLPLDAQAQAIDEWPVEILARRAASAG